MEIEKILITGGTGFVGQNTAKHLADLGREVVVTSRKKFDPVSLDLENYSKLIKVESCDLSDEVQVNNLFANHKFDGMIMLAQTHQLACSRREINMIYPIMLNCLEGARASGVKRAILGGSMVVYGAVPIPLSEDTCFPPEIEFTDKTPIRMTSFEVRAKRIIEQLVLDYGTPMEAATSSVDDPIKQHELEVAIARLPMQFGPGYRYAGNPLALACHAASGKIDDLANTRCYLNTPIKEFWNALLTGQLYVKDSASVLQTLLDAPTLPSRIYNAASGFTNSAREQLAAVFAAIEGELPSGLNLTLEDMTDWHSDVGFNNDRLKEDFGWQPSFTIETACKDYIEWLKENAF